MAAITILVSQQDFSPASSHATWVESHLACLQDGPKTCEEERGGLFKSNESDTWEQLGFYSLGLGTNLAPSDNATFGLETVALDASNATGGPNLTNQIVAALSGDQYPLGLFGLGRQPTNLSDFTNPHPSFLTTLHSQRSIPSLSWGYTAGARYQGKGVFGSLTLGGFDAARFIPNNVSFHLAQDISRDLVVGLRGIMSSESNGSQQSLLPLPHLTFIDSTIPYIYLPSEACDSFERVLGLRWDDSAQLYIVDEQLHQELLTRKPKFTFELGNSLTGGSTMEIVLPYSSFDLSFKPTYDSDPIRYFPLQRALNDSQLTLGRSFLQEAYIITNYETGDFSVSQCRFDEPMTQNIQSILPSGSLLTSDPTPPPTNSTQPPNSSEGRRKAGFRLDRSTTVAVIVGSILGLFLILGLFYGLYFLWYRRRRSRRSRTGVDVCSVGEAQPACATKHDSAQALQNPSTSTVQSDQTVSGIDSALTQEIDTNDWSLVKEISGSSRTELHEECRVFELPQPTPSVSSKPISQPPEGSLSLQQRRNDKRRRCRRLSTDDILWFITYYMSLTELDITQGESSIWPEAPPARVQPENSYLNRPLPPSPVSETPQRSSYNIWTRIAEQQHEKQSQYPSPLALPDDRYKHRRGFF
ncbi:MAG: hypothetical protein Q9178_002863 [Gyalolechia marmorata]